MFRLFLQSPSKATTRCPESFATGTPVVASAVDGLSDALGGLTPDLLVSPGNPAALAERLQGAVTGAMPLPTAEACRRHAENFSWTEVASRHLELYRNLAARASNAATTETSTLRVVVLGHTAQLSGGELAIQRAIAAMTNVEMHVILAEDGPLVGLLERAGASVEVIPMGESTRNLRKDRVRPGRFPVLAWFQSAAYVLRLARRLSRLHPDLVHTNTLKAALYGGMAARLAGIPCVWHVRDRITPDYLPSSAVTSFVSRPGSCQLPSSQIRRPRSRRLPQAGVLPTGSRTTWSRRTLRAEVVSP